MPNRLRYELTLGLHARLIKNQKDEPEMSADGYWISPVSVR